MSEPEPVAAPPPELLTPGEAAALLRVSVRTIRRWTTEGIIRPAASFGGIVRYARADLLATQVADDE